MYEFKYLLLFLAITVYSANARPTFDVLYKLAQDIENELNTDSQTLSRDHYRGRNPGYGYGPVAPPGNLHYPIYPNGHQPTYPGQYPSLYPTGPYQHPVANPSAPVYSGPYPPYGHYPSNNYIQGPTNPYVQNYPDQYGSNVYGHVGVGGSNSYEYGTKLGYQNIGY